MQLTTERLAGMTYVITGKRGEIKSHETGEMVKTQHLIEVEKAKEWQEKGRALREQARDHDKAMREKTAADFAQEIDKVERRIKGGRTYGTGNSQPSQAAKTETPQAKSRQASDHGREVHPDRPDEVRRQPETVTPRTYKGKELTPDQLQKLSENSERRERMLRENPGEGRDQQRKGGLSR